MTDKNQTQNKVEEELINGIYEDFKRRQEERRWTERGWELNMNFLSGNQYCDVNRLGEIEDDSGGFFWQERRVFNHIAPAIETRCCKLSGGRPKLAVRAASEEDGDKRSAQLSSLILAASCEDCNMDAVIAQATNWSETCGTAFYKIIWDSSAGLEIGRTTDGESVREGKVKVMAVSPFEIYPDSLSEESLYNQPSIIHARAVPVEDIFAAYGVELPGRDIEEFTSVAAHSRAAAGKNFKAVKHGYELVIERYMRPNSHFAQGRLTIVAGGKLLYDGDLPYVNGENGERVYPFARQFCIPLPGSFFGSCVVDRLIPVQRAYNAVKNRKHEFLNRISMGMVAVEDGSVDVEEMTEEGLAPGKIIVYRQGGTPPEMLTLGTVPSEFTDEEERLETEFYKISGTSDITQRASTFNAVTSATGLQLIIEQDEARLNVCYDQIKSALKTVGKFILRLYKQFASAVKLLKFTGMRDTLSVVSFKGSDITSDDVVLEADSEINMTPARRRAALYDMMDRGLFSDRNGEITSSAKGKILEALGYNGFSAESDLEELHSKRCSEENEKLKTGGTAEVKDYDDHATHIYGHTAFLLKEKLTPEQERRINAHLNLHKIKLSEVKNEG